MVMSRRTAHDQPAPSRTRETSSDRSKSKFRYQERTKESIHERATQQGSMFDSIFENFPAFKAKVGNNLLRVLPATWDNADHYGYDVFIHRGIGPDNSVYICSKEMGKGPCPICEERAYLDKEGDKKEADELKPQHRVIFWVIDRDNEAESPFIWDVSWAMDKDIASLSEIKRTGEFLIIDLPDDGYDFEFTREGTTMNNTKYVGKQIARRSSPISDDEDQQSKWLDFITDNPIPNILKFYDYDHIKDVFSGKSKEEEKPVESVRSRSLREDLDDEIVDEPVSEKKGVSRLREADKPVASKTRKTVAEPEEEAPEEEDDAPFDTDEDTVEDQGQDTEEADEQESIKQVAERTKERLRTVQRQVRGR
jgi:hypothetical protein